MSEKKTSKLKQFRQGLGLTQQEIAEKLGVSRVAYAAWEAERNKPSKDALMELRRMGYGADVTFPRIPAPELEVPIVSIGPVSASAEVDWTDPFASETFQYVPAEMGDDRGRFACTVASDSMMPLLQPNDECVFQQSDIPRIGCVILFRSFDNRITLKLLKHDGKNYYLEPLNPAYESMPAEGVTLGYLVGIVRRIGRRKITDYDSDGIRP